MEREHGLRSGQALIETLIAVIVITFAFLALFDLSNLLTGKIIAEHAAMRVARARSVGMNRFMCEKVARVATIPVAGERLWPKGEDALDWAMERSRVPIYLITADGARARGVLDYEGWHHLAVNPGDGRDVKIRLEVPSFGDTSRISLEGRAGVESNAALYMTDGGL